MTNRAITRWTLTACRVLPRAVGMPATLRAMGDGRLALEDHSQRNREPQEPGHDAARRLRAGEGVERTVRASQASTPWPLDLSRRLSTPEGAGHECQAAGG